MADSKELMKLDFYDILNLSIEARDNEVSFKYMLFFSCVAVVIVVANILIC